MNSYGYDYYIPNDSLEFDDSYYLETVKPYNKIENFDNDIEYLLSNEDEKNISVYKSLLEKKNDLCNVIYNRYNKCKQLVQKQFEENKMLNNQIYMFYIFLFIAIMVIIFQRININNLQQIIYLLKYNISTQVTPVIS